MARQSEKITSRGFIIPGRLSVIFSSFRKEKKRRG
jgi:hypothetical protein